MNIIEQLRRDEGEVLHVYQDTLGYWTIGVGRLVDKRKGGGISRDEAGYMLNNDVNRVTEELSRRLPWFVDLNEARRGALVNMAFQMGVDGLLGFRNSLELIRTGRWDEAKRNLLLSRWAQQTPQRAERVAEQMRTGQWV